MVVEDGDAGTSLNLIAGRAGTSKGVVTHHFRSKDEILREVVTRFFEQGGEHMEARIQAEESAIGRITVWITSELEFFAGGRAQHSRRDLEADDTLAFAQHASAGLLEPFLTRSTQETPPPTDRQ